MNPLVSCILTTRNRSAFLTQAIKYFLRQTYEHRELVIVDDSEEGNCKLVPEDNLIRYIKLDKYTPLGEKLNIGIAQSQGQIIQKLDDDDYYHPDFLTYTVSTLLGGREPERSLVGCDCFLVLLTATGKLKFSGHGWCAGGTLCFLRKLWQQRGFRKRASAVDWFFLQDHKPKRIKISEPELYILVRHQLGHIWNQLGQVDVTEYFSRQPALTGSKYDLVDA